MRDRDWELEQEIRRREQGRTWANRLGIAIAVILVGTGLAVVGFFVFVAIALSQMGSSK